MKASIKITAFSCVLVVMTVLSGCATLSGRDAPTVSVVGLEPLTSEGLELRFALKLRVQNPNQTPLSYNGLSVSLDLDGRGVASGVSDMAGEIARFSETVLSVPVSISAFNAFRQILARVGDARNGNGDVLGKPIAYTLKGKLGSTGASFAARFTDRGELTLFSKSDEEG